METDFSLEQAQASARENYRGSYTMSVPQLLPAQLKQLELLAHLASFSEMLVAVTGPEGSGKTTLAKALSAQCEEPEFSLFITADMMLGLPAILKSIAAHWDMPQLPDDLVAAREAVRRTAQEQAEEGNSLLVVIDQADQFDQDTLNSIAHFALMAPQAISFTLFGGSGFEYLFRESPAAAPLHVVELEALTMDESALLLQQVYCPGQPLPLEQDELADIYESSGGWPAPLLLAAEYFLLDKDAEPAAKAAVTEAKAGRFPLAHLLAIAVVAAALAISFLYRDDTQETPEEVIADAPSEVIEADPIVLPPVAQVEEAAPEPAPDLSALEIETAQVKPPEVASLTDYNYVEKKTDDTEQAKAVADKKVDVAAKRAEKTPAAVTEQKPVVAPKAAAPSRSYTAAEKVLLNSSNGFVVQLFGSYQAENAAGFRNEWQDKIVGSLYQYQTVYNNKPWHVVVAGVFNSRPEAKAAVDTMPQALRRQSPWIRDIKDVQAALKQ